MRAGFSVDRRSRSGYGFKSCRPRVGAEEAMTDPRQTYAHLSTLARDQAGTPEGETAARIAEKMRDRYGPDVETSAEELATVRLSFSNAYEKTILGRVALYLGLMAYTVGRRRTAFGHAGGGEHRATRPRGRLCRRRRLRVLPRQGARRLERLAP